MANQTAHVIDHPVGNYRFHPGIAPYSAGVVAMPGYEIIRVTLAQPVPYRAGFAQIEAHLQGLGRPRQALCAVELRLPAPRSFTGFIDFNRDYRAILAEWEILVGEENPVARTNVAPAHAPPTEPALYAFSYTVPSAITQPTFIVAGAGDLYDQANLSTAAVVRPGETSAHALQEKAGVVMQCMESRLRGLGMDWAGVTAIDVYTVYPVRPLLIDGILRKIGPAAAHGITWHFSHPPIADLAFEMDLRGIRQELRIA
ncbi:MAG: hypothetical protein KDE53_22695 [Caldilineaceae bacterium]|nr:hypothetical protein [Caldilineaceae bacterium]